MEFFFLYIIIAQSTEFIITKDTKAKQILYTDFFSFGQSVKLASVNPVTSVRVKN